MSTTRNNHYVPQWYQEGFFETGQNTLAYLDMQPPRKVLNDGRVIVAKSLFDAPTSRAFRQLDLYSTFFGTSVNDEIERRLFGDIDTRGSKAIKAFAGADVGEWHRHFDPCSSSSTSRYASRAGWLIVYPRLAERVDDGMRGIRMMHCTIWAKGTRNSSPPNAGVKFIVSDHGRYSHAVAPDAQGCSYPHDPRSCSRRRRQSSPSPATIA
jgi:hypothetical protein